MRRMTAAGGTSLFLAVAPGVVAGVLPWWLTGWEPGEATGGGWLAVQAAGAVVVAGCTAVLLQAFARFVTEGGGTPAPVAPTDRLVVGGLYRHVRNPMYVAVVGAVVGQALLLGRPVLLAYAVVVGGLMAAFVRGYEEPTLSRRYGADYTAYRRAVPAWLPRLRPWDPDRPAATRAPR